MKTKLIILTAVVSFVLFIGPVQAADCSNGTLQQQYLCLRFVAVNQSIDKDVYLDIKDVSAIKWIRETTTWETVLKNGHTISIKRPDGHR